MRFDNVVFPVILEYLSIFWIRFLCDTTTTTQYTKHGTQQRQFGIQDLMLGFGKRTVDYNGFWKMAHDFHAIEHHLKSELVFATLITLNRLWQNELWDQK